MQTVTDLLGKTATKAASLLGQPCTVEPPVVDPGEGRYIELPLSGMSLVVDEADRISHVQLHGPGRSEGYEAYRGTFWPGLDFQSGRNAVRAALGTPATSDDGGPGLGLFGGYLMPWDAFYTGEYRYHFEYSQECSGTIFVTISDSARGKRSR